MFFKIVWDSNTVPEAEKLYEFLNIYSKYGVYGIKICK